MKGRDVFLWVVGGSAGSFTPVRNYLHHMPYRPEMAILLCLHRMRNPRISMIEALGRVPQWQVIEPDDKTFIEGGFVYVAPADYHLLVEKEGYISLTVDEPVHFSRPSIDVLLQSVVQAQWPRAGAALLSGANRDGAYGMYLFYKAGYFTAVQDPADAEIATMPEAALALFEPKVRFSIANLVEVTLQALSL